MRYWGTIYTGHQDETFDVKPCIACITVRNLVLGLLKCQLVNRCLILEYA